MRARLVPVAGAALALMALTGCDQSPHTAAHVGSHTIRTDDVSLMSQALCREQSAAPAGQGSTRTRAEVNSAALGALITSAVDAQYAAAHHLDYDKASLAQQLSQLDQLIAGLPADDRARTRELITDLFRGELQVFGEALANVQATGVQPTQELVQQAAQALETNYAKKLSIKVNPRYDAPTSGHRGDGFQSLSEAVSADAKKGQSSQADPAWVATLPASLKCG